VWGTGKTRKKEEKTREKGTGEKDKKREKRKDGKGTG
jgi:hypothetical protein